MANWDLFSQALFHPIVNAVKYSRRYGVIHVTLTLTKRHENQAYLNCKVEDNGVGIARENLCSVFDAHSSKKQEEYFKNYLGSSTFAMTQGVNLGLSTTKSLVQIQGGHVKISSDDFDTTLRMRIQVEVVQRATHLVPQPAHDSKIELLP